MGDSSTVKSMKYFILGYSLAGTKRSFYVIKHFLANRVGFVKLMNINKGEELFCK